jgi:hypothetical protein
MGFSFPSAGRRWVPVLLSCPHDNKKLRITQDMRITQSRNDANSSIDDEAQ